MMMMEQEYKAQLKQAELSVGICTFLTPCCWKCDSSLVVGGKVYVHHLTSEFYFWKRVNVRVCWEILYCSLMLWWRMIEQKKKTKTFPDLIQFRRPRQWRLLDYVRTLDVLIQRYVLHHVSSHYTTYPQLVVDPVQLRCHQSHAWFYRSQSAVPITWQLELW